MQISEQGKAFIKGFESCRLQPYRDVVGIWTVGWGHALINGEAPSALTQDEADALFDVDVLRYADAVDTAVPGLWQNAFDAATSLAFNVGTQAFTTSSVARYLNAQMWADAGVAWLWWRKAGGKPVRGLLTRRAQEVVLFSTGEYE